MEKHNPGPVASVLGEIRPIADESTGRLDAEELEVIPSLVIPNLPRGALVPLGNCEPGSLH